jgi:phage terminase large subunit
VSLSTLQIKTPRWCLPLIPPKRLKGAKGGRSSGKSHFFAEALIERCIYDPTTQAVCVREIQKSLKFSAKKLLENKILDLGVGHLFEVTQTEIRRLGGSATKKKGIIIFQGLQDHTADSIKSLEDFDICWVEEAQSISKRSLDLLVPTIRAPKSELWFSWNPDQPDDPVEKLFKQFADDAACVHVNYMDNPFCPEESKKLAAQWQKNDPEGYNHVWLGGYNVRNESQVFNGKWRVDEFEPDNWQPIYGLDFGFAVDKTAANEIYIVDNALYIRREAGKVGLDIDQTAQHLTLRIPNIDKHVIRADSARPESISYLKRHGLPNIQAVKKWAGSVEDGIQFMRSFDEIVIHPDCRDTIDEFRLYSYKKNKAGDTMPQIEDKHNHHIDAIRYALEPMIKKNDFVLVC